MVPASQMDEPNARFVSLKESAGIKSGFHLATKENITERSFKSGRFRRPVRHHEETWRLVTSSRGSN